jgi:acetate CoA/acetoacetate CoA-transferase beta subunit
MQARERIAQRVAQELKDGDVVNLGIGLPTLVPALLPPEVRLVLQSDNGFVGLGSLEGEAEPGTVDAGGRPCGLQPGAAMFDSALSFCLIRGGHVDVTVLGGGCRWIGRAISPTGWCRERWCPAWAGPWIW